MIHESQLSRYIETGRCLQNSKIANISLSDSLYSILTSFKNLIIKVLAISLKLESRDIRDFIWNFITLQYIYAPIYITIYYIIIKLFVLEKVKLKVEI